MALAYQVDALSVRLEVKQNQRLNVNRSIYLEMTPEAIEDQLMPSNIR
jgi:hypothetical protein